eukprot:407850-Pyramimonas_sp.AAC.1
MENIRGQDRARSCTAARRGPVEIHEAAPTGEQSIPHRAEQNSLEGLLLAQSIRCPLAQQRGQMHAFHRLLQS